MSNSPNTASKRQPVSCEPCRHRKIKCGRGTPPCETCVRRGVGQHCTYNATPQYPSIQNTTVGQSSLEYGELLERFRSLESFVHQHIRSSDRSSETVSSRDDANEVSLSYGSEPGRSPIQLKGSSRGRLRVTSTGHVKYVTPNSAHWNAILGGGSSETSLDEFENASYLEDLTSYFPFETAGPVSIDELLRDLPPISYCDNLKACFFTVFSPLFHILHDPSFEKDYRDFKNNPRAATLSWLGLLFVILGIAVTALPEDSVLLLDLVQRPTAQENLQILASRYRKASMRCLAADNLLYRHNMHTLQALILLIYSINHSQGSTFPLLGMTYNIALAMGCHIDPENFGLDRLHIEERRRAWAGLLMLYTVQNTSMGNIDPSRLLNQVKLPADIDDIDLCEGHTVQLRQGPTQMSYLLFKFRLYNISAEICEQTFAASLPSPNVIKMLEEKITREQKIWNQKYASDSQQRPLDTPHMVHLNILFSYSHQLLLLLHRPSFFPRPGFYSTDRQRESQTTCIESAKAILAIHKTLAESIEFVPYRWYNNGLGSFHAFHATVLLAAVLTTSISSDLELDLKAIFADAMARFETMSSQSSICKRATPILKALWRMFTRRSESSMPPTESQNLQHSLDCDFSENAGNPEPNLWQQDPQMHTLMSQLRPEQWLGPGFMSWSEWSYLLGDTLVT